MQENEPQSDTARRGAWLQVRKLLVLQLKLYIDAFRDLCLSGLALGAFVIDLVQRNQGDDSYFEQVMRFGRRTERAINLFDQHDPASQDGASVDTILRDVEDRLRR